MGLWKSTEFDPLIRELNLNLNLKLRAIGRIQPFEAILNAYQKTPDIFFINPSLLIAGLGAYLYYQEL